MFRLAYFILFIIGLVILFLASIYRWFYYKEPLYQFSYLSYAKAKGLSSTSWKKKVIFFSRCFLLALLILLIARPQIVDSNAQVHVEGVDIMVVLDVSGSMQCFDDIHDQRSRIEVAKTEAIRFIHKREHDPIGLTIFGKYAVSRCPLTLDKKMLETIIKDLEIGVIDPQATALGIGMATAAARLKNSKAKSKIMILLTDGEPTPEFDIDPQKALDALKKVGIKVYTIAIGAEHGGLYNDPLFGIRQMGFQVNKPLLHHIAQETGGQFFEAKNAQDMKRIYAIIDALEKTEYETTVFTKYEDKALPLLLIALIGFVAELLVSTFVWFAL